MVMKPNFILKANNKEINDYLKNNIISLTFDDKSKDEADELSLIISGIYKRPKFKDELSLKLSNGNESYECGLFTIISSSVDYINNRTEVKASGIDFGSNLKLNRSKLYEALSLKDIVSTIASNNGLDFKSDADVFIQSKLQSNQSDVEFLSSLAKEFGYIFSIKNRKLLFLKQVETDALPEFTVNKTDCLSLRIDIANRKSVTGVRVMYQDINEAKLKIATVGSEELLKIVEDSNIKNENEALAFANAQLTLLKTGDKKGSLSIPARNIRAGGRLNLKGTNIDDGVYNIISVQHRIDSSGYVVDLEFE